MSDTRALDTQIAQHLFGWQWLPDAQLWRDPDGLVCDAPTFRRRLPAYSRVPDATARVWQWLETRGPLLSTVQFAYHVDGEEGPFIHCVIQLGREEGEGYGATWPEALCRAALALALALAGETPLDEAPGQA